MAALATPTDVEAQLGRTLTPDEVTRADAALDAASAFVRGRTGRRFEAGTFTVRRRAPGGRVTLPDVATVDAVSHLWPDGSSSVLSTYTLRGSTLYGLGSGCWVEVTYTSDGTVPEEIRGVTAAIAARELELPSDPRVGSRNVGAVGVDFVDAAAVPATAMDQEVLSRYSIGAYGTASLL